MTSFSVFKSFILSTFEPNKLFKALINLLKFLLMITTYNYGSNQKNELYIINTFTKPTTNEFYDFYGLNDHITFINDTLV